MSIRPRKEAKQPTAVSHGSLFANAIDFKPGFAPSNPVGVRLLNDDQPNPKFLIKFYYGPIKDDPDVRVSVPGKPDDSFYLRVRINMVYGKDDQIKLGELTMGRLKALLSKSYSFYEPMPGKAVHVCGNPANSYYVGYLMQTNDAAAYTADFRAMAKAIAEVPEDTEFTIDGHEYTYKIENVTESTAEMWATRTV
tara:strand:+ start:3270 stop:3854 length:585 start_codon:yes stop_codon:yes gene_type:complete